MKILIFSDYFKPEPSPPAAHVYDRAKLWAKAGHDVTVITSAPNFPEGKVYAGYKNRLRFIETMDGIRVVRVFTYIARNEGTIRRTLDYVSYMMSSFFFAFFEKRPDIVFSTSPHLFTSMGAVAHCFFRRLKHVMEVRDLWPASILATGAMKPGLYYKFFESIELKLYKRSRRVVCLSPAFVDDIVSRGIPAEKLDVVMAGADLDLFSPRPADEALRKELDLEGKLVIGYLGTLGLAHGLMNVIEAAKQLADEKVVFLFVGTGADQQTLIQAKENFDLKNVVLVPRQLKENMPRYWSITNIGLVHLKDTPLFSKVIPTKIFESMANGKPVLFCGPSGTGSGIVERHEAGWVVPAMKPEAIVEKVRYILANPDELTVKSKNSEAAAGSYSREAQARDSLAILEKATQA